MKDTRDARMKDTLVWSPWAVQCGSKEQKKWKKERHAVGGAVGVPPRSQRAAAQLRFEERGFLGQPSSNRCSIQLSGPGRRSLWHSGHRSATFSGLAAAARRTKKKKSEEKNTRPHQREKEPTNQQREKSTRDDPGSRVHLWACTCMLYSCTRAISAQRGHFLTCSDWAHSVS